MKHALPFVVLIGICTFARGADPAPQRTYTQAPEVAAALAATADAPAASKPALDVMAGGPAPLWIWGPDDNRDYVLRVDFEGGSRAARLRATCDNAMMLVVNGHRVATGGDWQTAVEVDIQEHIVPGKNTLLAHVQNHGGIAGFVLKLALVAPDGSMRYVVSDDTWRVGVGKKSMEWNKPRIIGKLGMAPWKDPLAAAKADTVARDVFYTLPGFQVERLFTVPKDELGSWVCIGLDHRGRLLVSDQGNLGMCRVTPPAIGGNEPTRVERLDVKISGVQGMTQVGENLYVVCNSGANSGLYRLRDTNGDDQYDDIAKLKELRGSGEHGPHGVRLSPDGNSLFVIGGNHTRPPFDLTLNAPIQTLGGIRPEPLRAELPAGANSRIMPNWDEDVLLPRQWDANGHAAGIVAPGGWIARTDFEGKSWEMFSVGYRNQYDMAFNADGELFAYDSDMEWDMGTPWYRPTRVTHATSGSEFGWRSGTADWPWYFVDSLPPLIDIGPGSPVGVEFGYGTRFPARYQRALYICDWTFGTIYALHLEPAGASYRAVKEEFVSRTPLPLTDAVVGRDGALYFTVGGRGTQSELFRVTYVGQEAITPADAHDTAGAELRRLRRSIEDYHVGSIEAPAKAAGYLAPHLGHADPHIRYAARVALERLPVETWQDRVFSARDPETVITGVVGLARQGDKPLGPRLLTALDRLDFAHLTEMQQLGLLRAYQLVFIRLGLPDEPTRAALGAKFEALFPSAHELVNRELAVLMVGLESPNAAHKLVPILTRPRVASQADLGEVLQRNKGYGGAISAVLANQPDQLQLHVALTLRNLKKGWTLEEKKTYFAWFEKARGWNGGNSYQKFLVNIDRDAFANSTDAERLAIEATGARQPFKMPELPKPRGPGRDYTLAELLSYSTTEMRGRSFRNGQKMFAAARCVVCHRFGGEGGSTGPDLTQAAGRFSFKDMAEAIVDPSKVVSDQYRTTIVETAQGKVYTGRVLAVTAETITMLIDPEDATKIVEIKKSDIESQELSPVSLMPKDLLKTLNKNEALDLMAYILSRGNPTDAMFGK